MKALILGAAFVSAVAMTSCNRGSNDQDAVYVLLDVTDGKSTGSETSQTGHALCFSPGDLLAFIQTDDPGSDGYQRKEAQQKALVAQDRCTFISGGVHYDIDAEGREIFHTPHGTVALWPGK